MSGSDVACSSQACLGFTYGKTLFVHGGVCDDNIGYIPGDPKACAAAPEYKTLTEWIVALNKWKVPHKQPRVRARCAVSGPDAASRATAICLRARYAMPGADLLYAARRKKSRTLQTILRSAALPAYAPAVRCPVLTQRRAVSAYAVRGTLSVRGARY
eukprot:3658784-Rhodomonas_salina.2